MDSSPSPAEYYLLYRKDVPDVRGKYDTGLVTYHSYTLEHIQKTHPEAVISGSWADSTNKRTLWLVSAEYIETPPYGRSSGKDAFEEETRIYWTSLLANLYGRLNDTGKAIVHQYLKEKPWADQKWFWTPLSFSDEVFRRLVIKIGFETEHTIEHLQEMGARLKTIYSFEMNKKSGGGYLSIPEPPVRVEPPKPEVTVEPVTKEENDALREKAMQIYLKLGEKGYREIHQFVTTSPMPGKGDGNANSSGCLSTWFKNLLSYLTPEELKSTVAKLEELFRDDINVDRHELWRRKAKRELDASKTDLVKSVETMYDDLTLEGMRALAKFMQNLPWAVPDSRGKLRPPPSSLGHFSAAVHKLVYGGDGIEHVNELSKHLKVIYDTPVYRRVHKVRNGPPLEDTLTPIQKRDLYTQMSKMFKELNLEGITALRLFMREAPWDRVDESPVHLTFKVTLDRLLNTGVEYGVADVLELEKHLAKIHSDLRNLKSVKSSSAVPAKADESKPSSEEIHEKRMALAERTWEIYNNYGCKAFDGIVHLVAGESFKTFTLKLTIEDLVELVSKMEKIAANLSNTALKSSTGENKQKTTEGKDDRKGLLVGIHKIFCHLNREGMALLREHFEATGKKDFGWHLIEDMTFEELAFIWGVMDSIASNPRHLDRWAKVPKPKEEVVEPKLEPAPLTKEESVAICDRAFKIYKSLRQKGYTLVHRFLTTHPMPIHKGFFEKENSYDARAFGKALAALTDRELQDLLAKMEEIFLDDNNIDNEETKRRAEPLLADANRIYQGLDTDCKRNVYAGLCNIFWSGAAAINGYLNDNAFSAATRDFNRAKADVLVDILKQVNAESILKQANEEEERFRIISKATALFRKLSRDGKAQVHYLMTRHPRVIFDRRDAFTPEYLEKLMKNRGLPSNEEIFQIVEGVYAKPEYRCSDSGEANNETTTAKSEVKEETEEEERLRLVEEARKLFSDLSIDGRDMVHMAILRLPWLTFHGGLITSQCFGEIIRTVRIQCVKELKKIVEEAYAIPSNRCLRPE